MRIVAGKLTAEKPVFLVEQHGMDQLTWGDVLQALASEPEVVR